MSGARIAARAVAAVALAGGWLVAVPAHADEVRDRQRPLLRSLGVEAAWKITKGDGVTVAVVDSGVDERQADLRGAVTTGPNMLKEVDAGSTPARLHGTAMASLIAGRGHGPGGRDGVVGMAPEARILSVRVIAEPEDAGYVRYRTTDEADGSVARGIRYAADNGADVINLSLGKDSEVPQERAAIGYAIGKGVVVVAAVGNEGDEERRLDGDGFAPYSYPASYPGVIAVAATESDNSRAAFSNRNYSVTLSAPGKGLPVAGPGDDYFLSSGTSDATAVVSGIAALIRAKYPDLPPALVSQALIESTRHGPSGDYDAEIGFGVVHASRALAAAGALTSAGAGAQGKPAGQRFGADPGPVEVIERPVWLRPLIIVIVLAGIGGTIAAAAIALTFRRRHPKPAGGPPAPEPPPGRPSMGRPPPGGRPLPPYGPPYGGGAGY
ncbi:S8 family serine peptidase [Actinomadura sp. 6K520]|uniref:S8 family serine peptidase n=1 Tax=Actinomadura sp. 6K520 TaxID=2530364 RepID=UPI001047DCE5|nr:S8 family serine peptidase [Actinomadura sp. 6K520]TDE22940.1 hypothetical protein E1289_29060 [Actinomadura sp. 6K520]